MPNSSEPKKDDTVQFFVNMTRMIYYMGNADISIKPLKEPKFVQRIHDVFKVITDILSVLLIVGEFGAIVTQTSLTERQKSNNAVFAVGHTFFFTFFFNVSYHQESIKDLFKKLLVDLKVKYSDEDIAKAMIKRVKKYNAGFLYVFGSAVVSYGVEGLIQVIFKDGTFTTVLSVWPDVRDKSSLANIYRVFSYFIYLVLMLKVCSAYITVIPVMICLSHQYKNLQSYFMNLANIFKEDLTQEEKELKYESAFKIGVVMHMKTNRCVRQCQNTFNILFSSQVILNVSVITMMMMQMVNSERTLFGLLTTVAGMSSVLFSTGFIMLNAGDVTAEAFEVTTAMYSSGWENCALYTVRVRKLLMFAMSQAQEPEILWVFKVVPLSYESFVSIVKSSYSIFSVLY